ncbi:DNA polymerase subunit gamma-2, mitochondrial isoform X2 [Aplysia californica]|nr:DNA polymerase subunit gamma-2, mitochondrial isoform X2 [Aplysia californica]
MGVTKVNFTNFFNLLQARGFVIQRNVSDSGSKLVFDHGPLGALLRQNILKQWWEVLVQRHSNVFPIECSPLSDVCDDNISRHGDQERSFTTPSVSRETLHEDCLRNYLHILKLTNGHLPFSIATAGLCVSCTKRDSTPQQDSLLGGSSETKLLLQNYVAPTSSGRIMDYWLQLRLSWWKNFSRNPANFTVTSRSLNNNNAGGDSVSPEGEDSSVNTELSIVYEFPWGQEQVEEIRNVGDSHLRHLQDQGPETYTGKTSGNKACLPHCIECSTSVELASAAWLIDSYDERKPISTTKKAPKKNKMVLHLHPQIAPYQVAVIRVSSSSSSTYAQEIHHVCTHLVRELQSVGMSVFNASEHGGTLEAHFTRNDQIGIPYTVILNENTLRDGSVNIRSRDTEIRTTSHIAQVASQMEQNLMAQLD